MEGVGSGDDDRLQLRIGQHRIIVVIALRGPPCVAHALHQVRRHVADGVKLNILRLGRRFKMRELRDGAAAEYAGAQEAWFLDGHLDCSASLSR